MAVLAAAGPGTTVADMARTLVLSEGTSATATGQVRRAPDRRPAAAAPTAITTAAASDSQ